MTSLGTKQAKVHPGRTAYECVDPNVGSWMKGFYEGDLPDDDKREFEEHLCFCFYCQDRLDELERQAKLIHELLRERGKDEESDKTIIAEQIITSGCY